MVKHSKKEEIESVDKKVIFLRKLLFSMMLLLVISIFYTVLANIFIDVMDDKLVDKDANLPKISKFEMNSYLINVNGIKSPNLGLEVLTDKPTKLIIEISGPDFFKRINNNGFDDEYNFNLILPEDLIGEDISLKIMVYDEFSQENVYKKSYSIPTLNSPSISVN